MAVEPDQLEPAAGEGEFVIAGELVIVAALALGSAGALVRIGTRSGCWSRQMIIDPDREG